jgi:hypothetical protein
MGVPEETPEPMCSDSLVHEGLKEDEKRGKFVDFIAKTLWRTKG